MNSLKTKKNELEAIKSRFFVQLKKILQLTLLRPGFFWSSGTVGREGGGGGG